MATSITAVGCIMVLPLIRVHSIFLPVICEGSTLIAEAADMDDPVSLITGTEKIVPMQLIGIFRMKIIPPKVYYPFLASEIRIQ